MKTCAAPGCPSTQSAKINGSPITFFTLPENDLKRDQWLRNCDLTSSGEEPLYLCELHFEKAHFKPASKELKSNAVPTLFGRTGSSKEQKENISQTTPVKVPSKRKKVDEHLHAIVTPPQSPSGPSTHNNTADMDYVIAVNGSPSTNENSEKTYRLIIQIDKIRSKPGPRCKKARPLVTFNNDTKDTEGASGSPRKLRPLLMKKPCIQGNCRLRKCVYKGRLAFQCDLCEKYYLAKKQDVQTKRHSCTKCSKIFPDSQSLYEHIKKHFICDICLTECNTQVTFDKHIRLHVSTDPLYPYKCHQCQKIFDVKDGVKQHCLLEHPKGLQNTVIQVTSPITTLVPQTEYFCVTCKTNFTNDQAYRSHVSSKHGKNESVTCNITSEAKNIISVPNPITGSPLGILQAVKFSCRVCSKEFDNVAEVDLHTRTHLEVSGEELRCNICKKLFKSSAAYSEHLKHHLSRGHSCPICSKAFINKTTLNIHLKTHPAAAQ
ncbi:PREDICTED: zinc finger protein 26-like [Wasmannia auropunctata]|uniref:zinc finger protein 26-like n=1 Tax=Wasmannia auropunctata TaxID=64793 RepID=UPI0005EE1A5B|nr:PREDICTED: zinc finger protein 26-like [Wasmannia auropunctata]